MEYTTPYAYWDRGCICIRVRLGGSRQRDERDVVQWAHFSEIWYGGRRRGVGHGIRLRVGGVHSCTLPRKAVLWPLKGESARHRPHVLYMVHGSPATHIFFCAALYWGSGWVVVVGGGGVAAPLSSARLVSGSLFCNMYFSHETFDCRDAVTMEHSLLFAVRFGDRSRITRRSASWPFLSDGHALARGRVCARQLRPLRLRAARGKAGEMVWAVRAAASGDVG